MANCNVAIGRLSAIGIGKEVTPGVPVEPTAWIPVESGEVTPIIKTVEDTSGYGIIDKIADVMAVENTSETAISGIIRSESIGHILMATLGIASAPKEVETGVYEHKFSRKNDNCPITHTITEDTPAGAKQAPYSVIDSLDIEGKVGDYVRFTVKYIGGQIITVTDKNPTYLQENVFVAAGMSVKMANTTTDLQNAPKVRAQSFKFTITKGAESIMALGSTNVDAIHNTVLEIKGDMELVYDSDTMMQRVIDGSKQAISVLMETGEKIGATKKASLEVTFPRVALSEWKKSGDMDKIVTQTVGFTGTYDVATAASVVMTLINKTKKQY